MKLKLKKFLAVPVRIVKKMIYLPVTRFIYLLSWKTHPISKKYGLDRGTPIDRYYIEQFLKEHNQKIIGRCLEIRDDRYTTRFGQNKVSISDILDIDQNNPAATIYGDLRNLPQIKDGTYDCIILTQVLQFIDDTGAAISECHRILKPGGYLLATVPSLSRLDCRSGRDNDFWRFTVAGCRYLTEKKFDPENITITAYGNTLSGLGFWVGLAKEELLESKLDIQDPDFPCLIAISAKK